MQEKRVRSVRCTHYEEMPKTWATRWHAFLSYLVEERLTETEVITQLLILMQNCTGTNL